MNVDYVGEFNEPDARAPLLWCLLGILSEPLDPYLGGILPLGKPGYCGGDPGWEISTNDTDNNERFDDQGRRMYFAWTDPEMSGLNPNAAWYSEDVVRHHLRRVLENFLKVHPDRKVEVDSLVLKYKL